MSLGVWALIDKIPWIGELVGNDLLTGAVYVLLVGGIVVAFIAFFGCIGASREVKCMLLTVSGYSSRTGTINIYIFRALCLRQLGLEWNFHAKRNSVSN